MDKFSPKTIEALGYYVYIYSDPVTKVPFYVGKGKGNRAFAHLHDGSESDKARKIAEIQARGRQPLIEILAFGLENSLNELLDLAYRGGFVPVDYEVVYQSI